MLPLPLRLRLAIAEGAWDYPPIAQSTGLCSRSPAAHGGGPVANAYDLIGEVVEGGIDAATKAFESSVLASR